MKYKLKFIFIPFVLLLIGMNVGYALLHIILLNNIIAIVLALVVVFLFFSSSKIDILKDDGKGLYTFHTLIYLVAFLTVVTSSINARDYAIKATGKITELNSLKEINSYKPTTYYSLKNYYIDKRTVGVSSKFNVNNYKGKSFNIRAYYVMPIFENAKDTSTKEPLAWLGIKYYQHIGDVSGLDEKRTHQGFLNKTRLVLEDENVSEFAYLKRVGVYDFNDESEDTEGYAEAIKRNPAYKSGGMVFNGVNEPFEERGKSDLEWLFGSAIIGSLLFFVMLLFTKVDQNMLKYHTKSKAS